VTTVAPATTTVSLDGLRIGGCLRDTTNLGSGARFARRSVSTRDTAGGGEAPSQGSGAQM
jgi:hypothetical protein